MDEAARQLVRVLRGSRIPFVITTLSPGGANEAEAAGLPVLRGDYSRPHTLVAAGVERAKMLVIVDDDTEMSHRVVAVSRSLAPAARIVVRTRYLSEAAPLRATGADLVVVDELETVVQIFAELMRAYELTPDEIERHEATIRAGGYAALLGPTEGPAAAAGPHRAAARIHEEGPLIPRQRSDIDPQQPVTLEPKEGTCPHVSAIHAVYPSARGCQECLQSGDAWVHLRICMSCGHVGCCDSSKNKHATQHFRASRHPIVRSLEPGERWGWCYDDEVVL